MAVLAAASSRAQVVDFGGPDAVSNTLATDREQVDAFFRLDALTPYFEFKDRLAADNGLSFGLDYTGVGFSTRNSLGDSQSGGGIARLFATWEMTGRGTPDTGALVFKGEHRHGYTDVPPSGFAIGGTGYAGIYEAPFSDQGFRLSNLYWRQRLNGGRVTITAGFLDATDYVDAFALASPWTGFGNFAFSTGSAAIGLPGDATLGIAGAAMLSESFYVIAGITDANADPPKPFDGFDNFISKNRYFTSFELGWTTNQERLIFDNIHVTAWHTDGSDDFAVNDGWGVAGSATWYAGDQWLPFLRGGYADDGGTLLQKSISTGFGWQPVPGPGRDLIGFGLNWGQPNEDTFGPGLRDQYAAEVFARINLGENIAVTPSLQFIKNPALNPDRDSVAAAGIRLRLAL
jgi:porin